VKISRLHACGLALALLSAASMVICATVQAQEDTGGVPREVETAVDRGLEWLAHNQQRDGSWSGGGMAGAACTGLSIMAFMARGHVPSQGPYGDNLNRAVDALLSMQQADGVIAERGQGNEVMYDHGISTVALCEAYGMLDEGRQAKARTAIGRAVQVILRAQAFPKSNPDSQGGWRYTPEDRTSDISVTGWQLMALRGSKNVGAYLPAKAIDDGIAYVKRRAVMGGGFSYTSGQGGANLARSGTGVLALSLMGKPNEPEVKAAGDYMLRTDLQNADHYYYAVYYCSQAAWQLGGQYWATLNARISRDLLSKARADGSWGTGGGGGGETAPTYCTSMAILALTVPYRYLPIYQR
jgi:hypothetical protein